MKLQIQKQIGVVEDAFLHIGRLSLGLFINTRQRWRKPDSYGSSHHGGKQLAYEVWYTDDNYPQAGCDIVRLVPETARDRELLAGLHFELHCKEQLWILMTDADVTDYDGCPAIHGRILPWMKKRKK